MNHSGLPLQSGAASRLASVLLPASASVVALVVTLAAPREALAQRSIAIGVGAGVAVPVGRLDDVASTGPQATAFVAFGGNAYQPLGIRIEGSYLKFAGQASSDPDLRLLSLVGNLVAMLGTDPNVAPYLTGGFGLYGRRFDPEPAGETARNDVGLNGGLGVRFAVGRANAFAEVRIHNIFSRTASGGRESLRFVPIAAGVMF